MQQDYFPPRRDVPVHVVSHSDTRRDDDATKTATQNDVAATSRQRFTMSVEGVASLLHSHGLDRDARTIQRWCKSGKIAGIIDHVNGDRWLIDPATVQPVIDDILANMSRQPQPFSDVSRPVSEPAATVSPTPADSTQLNTNSQSDTRRDSAEYVADSATTSESDMSDVATLRRQISGLETENAKLQGAVQVRDQMVDYLKEQFEKILENTLDRAEMVGQLEAENRALKAALPPDESASEPTTEAIDLGSYEPNNPRSPFGSSV
ncbi:hypothetical protein [uncultured Tateyamaria sp.]|uniref:hypothetical protein n=1 Tax=uncultured Tateyamaria sp. TaxID=455651 RepID=UPI00261B1719|nr:hypothetical protein [uncultured Tateyamaria sp.]